MNREVLKLHSKGSVKWRVQMKCISAVAGQVKIFGMAPVWRPWMVGLRFVRRSDT